MYKKKPTKSFFDNGHDNNSKLRKSYPYRNKENVSKACPPNVVKPGRTISGETIAKLSTFTHTRAQTDEPAKAARTPVKEQQALFSSSQAEAADLGGSQAEDRVRWKISPPPSNKLDASAHKLTINEMFDIYQASQHSAETPVRHLDPTGDLWSRYDSAEPLPYLDLELSPGPNKTPRSDAKLRRTTSLPTWSVDPRTRKRRKLTTDPDRVNCRVRTMMEQVQLALVKGHPASSEQSEPTTVRFDDVDRVEADTRNVASSDDFGGDDLDDAYLALPDLRSPPPRRSTSNPLPTSCKFTPAQTVHTDTLGQKADFNQSDSVPIVNGHRETNHVSLPCADLPVSRPSESSSDYGADFDERDFLEASQSACRAIGPSRKHGKTTTDNRPTKSVEKVLTPAQLLEGLEDDVFSDFEEDFSEHRDVSPHIITDIARSELQKGTQLVPQVTLKLRSQCGQAKEATLEGDWTQFELSINDEIRLHGVWHSRTHFVATNFQGLLVLYPDVLVSCTSVADAHTCMRKSVLQDRVRATSSLSKALLYGSMVHAMLQTALSENNFSDIRMRKEIDVQVEGNLEKLYLVDESVQDAKDYLFAKVALLQSWAVKFFGNAKTSPIEPMRGKGRLQDVSVGIRSVLDIEERFWSPLYGLKGNVDVTAEFNMTIGVDKAIYAAPLEFKTGKTDYQQSSYRAQVMLYTLMISERYGVPVPAGFLYYLETGQITRVAALHNEIRGLLMMRNELARHMKHKTIPAMISNKRLCSSCYASEACFIYNKSMKEEAVSTEIDELLGGRIGHLRESDIAFFQKWEALITKEEGEMFKFRHELWRMTSEEREKLNRCFSNLLVVPGSEHFDSTYGKMNQWTYILKRNKGHGSLFGSQIAEREPIIVSDEKGQYAISCGFVVRVTTDTITVNLDRPLRDSRSRLDPFDENTSQLFRGSKLASAIPNLINYRLDRDEFKNGMGLVRSNLISLLLSSESKNATINVERLRNLIIDLEQPKFCDNIRGSLERSTAGNLNVDQIEAQRKVLSAKDYALILGMPGTGKTTTIAHVIKSLVDAGKSVLLTSYTHSAVDTIILKLAEHRIKILRLGGRNKIHPDVFSVAATELNDCNSFEELHNHYTLPNVVATTCLSINHAIFQKRRFDYCIFDEASQATLPVCLGPLRFADRFVLVGDHYQLPPLVKDLEAKRGGLDVSLFKILCEAHPEAVVELKHQYRMNADIMSISNQLIYNGRLTCGHEALKERQLQNIHLAALASLHSPNLGGSCVAAHCWLNHTIDPAQRVLYLNTDMVRNSSEVKNHDQITNQAESTLTCHIVEGLLACGMPPQDVGVISPYRSQLKIIQRDLRHHSQITIDTADKFQGRDKECIIVSLVRANANRVIGDLLKDWRRINVAFTRAKSKMIIIGSQNTLANDRLLNEFLHLVHRKGWAYDLPADALITHEMPPHASLLSAPIRATQVLPQDLTSVKQTGSSEQANAPRVTKVVMASKKIILAKRPILRDIVNSL